MRLRVPALVANSSRLLTAVAGRGGKPRASARGPAARFARAAAVSAGATTIVIDGFNDFAAADTALHHVPSPGLHDRLLAEVRRVLRPRGVFVGSDSLTCPLVRLVHVVDTLVPVDPDGFFARLENAGLADPEGRIAGRSFRFRASF